MKISINIALSLATYFISSVKAQDINGTELVYGSMPVSFVATGQTKRIMPVHDQYLDLDQVIKVSFGMNEALYKQSQYLLNAHQADSDLLTDNPTWAHPQAQTFSNSSNFSDNLAALANAEHIYDVVLSYSDYEPILL